MGTGKEQQSVIGRRKAWPEDRAIKRRASHAEKRRQGTTSSRDEREFRWRDLLILSLASIYLWTFERVDSSRDLSVGSAIPSRSWKALEFLKALFNISVCLTEIAELVKPDE